MQFSFYDDPFLRIAFTFHRRCQIFGIQQTFMGFLQQLVIWYIIYDLLFEMRSDIPKWNLCKVVVYYKRHKNQSERAYEVIHETHFHSFAPHIITCTYPAKYHGCYVVEWIPGDVDEFHWYLNNLTDFFKNTHIARVN